MANNVNCKEMRFVIRKLVDVDDVSPATAPEVSFDVCQNYVGISLSDETKVIEPVGEPHNTT